MAANEPTGKPKQVTEGYQVVGDLAWTADGKEILFYPPHRVSGQPLLRTTSHKVAIACGVPVLIVKADDS